jgi:dTDP-4-dehydrorhamnose reductase
MAAGLARDGRYSHPVLRDPGWWRRPSRLTYAAVGPGVDASKASGRRPRGAPILITGATGTLGRALGRACRERGLAHRLLTRQQLDVAEPQSVAAALRRYEPWAIVNAAGYVRVDDAEGEASRCQRENVIGPMVLADACALWDLQLLTFSSDLVFDGAADSPYVESAPTGPLGVYGASKVSAEAAVSRRLPPALVIRTSAFFSAENAADFLGRTVAAVGADRQFMAADDTIISPTYVPDLADASLDLLIDAERGVWHLANVAEISWVEFARRAAELRGLDASLIQACALSDLGGAAARPRYSALGSERGVLLPTLDDALARWARASEAPGSAVDLVCEGETACTTT